MPNIAVKGDTTSHGGHLVGTGSALKVDGQPVALCGEVFHCPDHDSQHILNLNSNVKVNGVSVALSGFHTSCGATIIGSATTTGSSL